MQNTTESNKLIAAFIELEVPQGVNYMVEVRGDIKKDLLAFDTDWNRLFKAIDKIESLGYKFRICRRRADISLDNGASVKKE